MWAIDFQADHLEDGTRFKIASILDEHTRRIVDDNVDVSITREDLVGILERLSITHGLPAILRMDNGPELTCQALAEGPKASWAWYSSRPVSPGATATSSRSTHANARHSSTSTPSPPCCKHESNSPTGTTSTTTSAGTHA